MGSLSSNPEKIKITGPKSLINKIDKVNASIDVDGATEDVTQETEVKIIDKNLQRNIISHFFLHVSLSP